MTEDFPQAGGAHALFHAVDMDGNLHILNGSIDMGAYEYGPPVFSLEIAEVIRAAGAGVRLRWNS